MSRRFLQVFGFLCLVALLAASVGALLTVKGHFTVTVAETKREAGPDPVALLRDDVSSMRRDLAALVEALKRDVESRPVAADEDAARAQALARALVPLSESISHLADRLESGAAAAAARAETAQRETATALRDLRGRIDALPAKIRRPESAVPAAAPPAPAVATLPAPLPPALPPVASEALGRGTASLPPPAAGTAPAPPAPAPPAGVAAAPSSPAGTPVPAKRRGFLSFSLPSEGFEPARLTKFEVVPSLSRVGFDAKSTLHDFSGATSEVSGTVTARLARPGQGTTASLEAQAATLDTGIVERNGEMGTALDVKAYPTVAFALTAYVPTRVDAATGGSEGTATGTLTIHGVAREISAAVRVSVDEGKRLVIEGETSIHLSGFGVKPPKKFGLIAVEDEIKVWWSVRARAVGRAE